MLFNKNMEPCCIYCSYGVRLNENNIACLKHGIVNVSDMCPKFNYDPLKRVPGRPRKISMGKYTEVDFSL